jgi:hypothetical protein
LPPCRGASWFLRTPMHLPTDSTPPLILLDGPCAECGAYVWPYWSDAGAEWFWRDEHGRAFAFDVHPGDVYTDLTTMRERVLAGEATEAEAADYSALAALIAVRGAAGRWHYHRPLNVLAAYDRAKVPECCGWPMRWTGDGWRCREGRGRPLG